MPGGFTLESPLRAYLEGLLSEVVATAKRGDDEAIEWLRRFPELPAFGESVAAAARGWERAHSIAELSDSDDSGEDSDEDDDGQGESAAEEGSEQDGRDDSCSEGDCAQEVEAADRGSWGIA